MKINMFPLEVKAVDATLEHFYELKDDENVASWKEYPCKDPETGKEKKARIKAEKKEKIQDFINSYDVIDWYFYQDYQEFLDALDEAYEEKLSLETIYDHENTFHNELDTNLTLCYDTTFNDGTASLLGKSFKSKYTANLEKKVKGLTEEITDDLFDSIRIVVDAPVKQDLMTKTRFGMTTVASEAETETAVTADTTVATPEISPKGQANVDTPSAPSTTETTTTAADSSTGTTAAPAETTTPAATEPAANTTSLDQGKTRRLMEQEGHQEEHHEEKHDEHKELEHHEETEHHEPKHGENVTLASVITENKKKMDPAVRSQVIVQDAPMYECIKIATAAKYFGEDGYRYCQNRQNVVQFKLS